MQFNEIEFRVKLETLLYQCSKNKGLSAEGIKAFTNDATNYAESLYGYQSIVICPFCQHTENMWKLNIYVCPDIQKYNYQYDFHFDVPMIQIVEN